MGTLSTTKFLKNSSGNLAEEAALTTSAGAGDAQKLPALNASGILDSTIINSKTTSAGAGDSGKVVAMNASGFVDDTILNASATTSANKVVKMNGSGIIDTAIINSTIVSAGAGDSAKHTRLDATGKLDVTVLPVGVGPDTKSLTTSEALAAGDFVNIHNSTGAKARKADATTAGKEAHGFVLSAFGLGVSALVYMEGTNTAVTGATPGPVFLNTTAGGYTATSPSASGNISQKIGVALSATEISFEPQPHIILA